MEKLERHDAVAKQIDKLDRERRDNHNLYKSAKVIIYLLYFVAAPYLLISQSDEEKAEAKNRGVQYKRDIASLEASYSIRDLLSC